MRARIRFEKLPARARPVLEEEASAIFGGCVFYKEMCRDDCDCCSLTTCKAYLPNNSQRYCVNAFID